LSANTPIPIPDNSPPGVEDVLVFPDVGVALDISVSLHLTNSDLNFVSVTLTDPNSDQYVLFDGDHFGVELDTSYPEPTPPVSGDLDTWIGLNPTGNWELKVVDSGYLNNMIDGEIVSWGISIVTTGGETVRISQGGLEVAGHVGIGTTEPLEELHVVGAIHCTGKLTSTGGYDPPYVLYDQETRRAIIERVAREVPVEKRNGAVLFWNGEELRFEVYLPASGEFRNLQGKLLEKL